MARRISYKGQGKYTWVLDPGHGGWKNGAYATSPRIGKKYTFTNREGGYTFYEGVFNRLVTAKLKDMMEEAGLSYYDSTHDLQSDVSLRKRVERANSLHVSTGRKAVFVSIHGNAHGAAQSGEGTSARGFAVYTSPGETGSDPIAEQLARELRTQFPKLQHRRQFHDQLDWEARFYVLVNTACPAILSENLFYTNWEDVKVMRSEAGQEKIARAHLDAMLWHENR